MQKPILVLVLNWLLLAFLLWFSLFGFMVFMLMLAMTGHGKKKAAALMARQAYIFERSARIEQVGPLQHHPACRRIANHNYSTERFVA